MLTIDSTFKSEKNKSENQPIFLYTLHEYDGSNNLALAEYESNVTYDSIVYTAFNIRHDQVADNSSSQIDTLKVTVANVNRVFQAYLETYDLRGKKVTITLVWANQLADTDAHVDFVYYIDSYTATEETVEFNLTSRLDILDAKLPYGKFSRNFCRWKFKSTECGYAGAQTTCDKTKATCRDTMSNVLRFGGFPSVPTTRIYV